MISLDTPRLLLRPWQPSDFAPFRALNASPDVMKYFPACLTAAQSDALAEEIIRRFTTQNGFGLWAVEEKSSGAFAGFTGLNIPGAAFDFNPCVEIGWRLATAFHGKGYATEAAQAVLKHAFTVIELPEIVAFTSVPNTPSARVMIKLGMRFERRFEHPSLTDGHPLKTHVLYKITRQDYLAQRAG